MHLKHAWFDSDLSNKVSKLSSCLSLQPLCQCLTKETMNLHPITGDQISTELLCSWNLSIDIKWNTEVLNNWAPGYTLATTLPPATDTHAALLNTVALSQPLYAEYRVWECSALPGFIHSIRVPHPNHTWIAIEIKADKDLADKVVQVSSLFIENIFLLVETPQIRSEQGVARQVLPHRVVWASTSSNSSHQLMIKLDLCYLLRLSMML